MKNWFESSGLLDKTVLIISSILLFIVVVATYQYFSMFAGQLSFDQTHWGLFGDYIGGVGGMLISLIAVLLIFITYRLQQKELNATNKALKAQNTQLKIQQHYNIVFNLLERKDLLLKNMPANLSQVNSHYDSKAENLLQNGIQESDIERKSLKKLWEGYGNLLMPYFNVFSASIAYLYNFDSTNHKEAMAKERAFRIFSSSLTSDEKTILKRILKYHEIYDSENNEVNACREYVNQYLVLN